MSGRAVPLERKAHGPRRAAVQGGALHAADAAESLREGAPAPRPGGSAFRDQVAQCRLRSLLLLQLLGCSCGCCCGCCCCRCSAEVQARFGGSPPTSTSLSDHICSQSSDHCADFTSSPCSSVAAPSGTCVLWVGDAGRRGRRRRGGEGHAQAHHPGTCAVRV